MCRGFDVRTGKRLWIFHTIPKPGEFGSDTWEKDALTYTGNTGVWGQISVDEELGIAYLPVELPTGDVYGGHRPGNGLFGETLLAVDLQTGKRIWHYQLVHHGLWDMDIPCAPILVNIPVNGRTVKAVAQPTKQGFLYVFDRTNGKPIWPIEEKPVPKGDVPGEWYSPTQPIPTKPPAYENQGVSIDKLIDFTPELRAEAVKMVAQYKMGPLFTPPIAGKLEGPIAAITSPGMQGGINWPGGAYDPDTHMVYVYSQTTHALSGVVTPADAKVSDMRYIQGRPGVVIPSAGGMYAPGAAAVNPEGGGRGLTVRGLPLLKPPYGRITALDLNKGDIAWQIAHGETPDNIRNSPDLKGVTIPRTGRPGILGPLATKSLVICGESGIFTLPSGQRGAMLRAYDKLSGKEVGAVYMPAPQTGSPMTYMLNGEQYLVLAISGANYAGELVAFKLPSDTSVSAPAAGNAPVAAVTAHSVWDGVYSKAQVTRGQVAYRQNCASCHGGSLEGIEMAPALAGPDFIGKWAGQTVGDLFERIRTTMPANRPGKLTREMNADITAYMLSANSFAAGQADLPSDTPALKQIRIDAAKPK